MKINQAFAELQNAGGVRAARIITENAPKLTRWRVWWYARALRRGVPVAKIIHKKWFFGMEFYTNKWTLDPRPDTETLVECVINDHKNNAPRVLDLGTGTGCIVAAIVKNISGAAGVGIDRSRMACAVARRNIAKLGLAGRIEIQRGNFNNKRMFPDGCFDIIVSNPPYIARGDARVDAGARHDPAMALYAGDGGFAAYVAIAKNARKWIRAGGTIYTEIGIDMDGRVRDIFESHGWTFVRAVRDLGGINRVMVFLAGSV